MTKTKLFLLCAFLMPACAGGEDDRDTVADDTSGGSVADSSSGSATMTTTMTTDTMTTSPTTASTLTTDATETTEADSGTESTTGEPDTLSCENYCSIYAASCADFSEYAVEADCLANCALWPIGEAADTAVDTLGCRIYHAGVAGMSDPATHCPHAGPSGDSTCFEPNAPDCENYCMVFATNCVDGLYTYEDNDDCLNQCATWYPGTAKDTEGHTVGCHTYHAGAAQGGPEEHCPHAGAGGGGICVL